MSRQKDKSRKKTLKQFDLNVLIILKLKTIPFLYSSINLDYLFEPCLKESSILRTTRVIEIKIIANKKII